MNLHVETGGQGPDLVLLHGWGMNLGVWQPIYERLCQRFRVHMIELPGHGASAPLHAADLSQWAAACLAVAPQRARWLGWSLGGQVAMAASLAAPERVEQLYLVSATPSFVQRADWPPAMPQRTFKQFADVLADDAHGTLARFLGLQVTGSEHPRETLKQLREAVASRPEASPEGLAQGLQLLLSTDLRERLHRISCPSCWVFGERDTLVPSAAAEAIAALLPQARIERIAGAAHAPFLSHPDASLALLETAL